MSLSSANTLISPAAHPADGEGGGTGAAGAPTDEHTSTPAAPAPNANAAATSPSAATSPPPVATSPATTTSSTGQRKHSRTHSVHTHSTHGHGHGATMRRSHTSHSGHGVSRASRRSSEGEHGRRALASGLAMNVIDNAPKGKRKTSDHVVHTAAHRHSHLQQTKSSRSETNLTKLSRTPSSSTMSALTSDSNSTAAGASRISRIRSRSRSRRREPKEEAGEVLEVLEGEGVNEEPADDSDWESGEETPAPGSRRPRGSFDPAKHTPRRVSAPAATGEGAQTQTAEDVLDLGAPSPNREPPMTRRTTGFPGAPTPLTPASNPSPSVTNQAGDASHSVSERSASATSIVDTATPLDENKGDGAGFPFPDMHKEKEEKETKETHTDDYSASSPKNLRVKDGKQKDKENGVRNPSSAPIPAPLMNKQPSHSSLRSLRSLRAPHPLNSPRLSESVNSKRVSSLHYPPAAPAVVYRETVGGQGWDDAAPRPGSSPTSVATSSLPSAPEPRPRVGSVSSVRSLKDVLGGSGLNTPNMRSHHFNSAPASRTPSRRLTAMQAASAASRLNTTSDPVAYHQSLGFSPTTAETAHLLSRFLPVKKPRRPHWIITAREAHAAHEAAERGEIPDYRIGLTEGQYRDAHESLVHTLKSLARQSPRRARTSGYGYASSLLSSADEPVPRVPGSGQTPFEASVARCIAQRPPITA